MKLPVAIPEPMSDDTELGAFQFGDYAAVLRSRPARKSGETHYMLISSPGLVWPSGITEYSFERDDACRKFHELLQLAIKRSNI